MPTPHTFDIRITSVPLINMQIPPLILALNSNINKMVTTSVAAEFKRADLLNKPETVNECLLLIRSRGQKDGHNSHRSHGIQFT